MAMARNLARAAGDARALAPALRFWRARTLVGGVHSKASRGLLSPGVPKCCAEIGGRFPEPCGQLGGFCCQAPPEPRLALLRRQGFKVEFDRTAYAARAYS